MHDVEANGATSVLATGAAVVDLVHDVEANGATSVVATGAAVVDLDLVHDVVVPESLPLLPGAGAAEARVMRRVMDFILVYFCVMYNVGRGWTL